MSDFQPGDRVTYRYRHEGVVTSVNDQYVFVRFDPSKDYGVACYPRDLRKAS